MHALVPELSVRHTIGSSRERRQNVLLAVGVSFLFMSPMFTFLAGHALRLLLSAVCSC